MFKNILKTNEIFNPNMKNIYYFNIDYFCNNNCIFCFSSSTGTTKKAITLESFINTVKILNPDENDLIVLNGGEPSLHPSFYDILAFLCRQYDSYVAVYSNGTILDVTKIPNNSKLRFIIPIHGDKILHDRITQNSGSFNKTLKSIYLLQQKKCRVNIKFIVSQEMLESNFNIQNFLESKKLFTDTIIIARMNNTKKSKKNNVKSLFMPQFSNFIQNTYMNLHKKMRMEFLDVPVCFLPHFENYNIQESPSFYFSDYNHNLQKRNYFKKIRILENCKVCKQIKICRTLESSYLTPIYDKRWIIDYE